MQSSRALPNTFAFIDVDPSEPIKISLKRQLCYLIQDENERNSPLVILLLIQNYTEGKKSRSELGAIYVSRKLKILNSSGSSYYLCDSKIGNYCLSVLYCLSVSQQIH